MPNQTSIKTRQGYILERCVALALEAAKISFRNGWQYDADSEIPDFSIPDDDQPNTVIEVHQTDARNSFQMKLLRAFTATAEAKAHFGPNTVSVNILFGRPGAELPESNIACLSSFFDVNIVLHSEEKLEKLSKNLEDDALKESSKNECNIDHVVQNLAEKHSEFIRQLGLHIKNKIGSPARDDLLPLWSLEQQRVSDLAGPPEKPPKTFIKRGMLNALFLSDELWEKISQKKPFGDINKEVDALVNAGILVKKKTLRGNTIEPSGALELFLSTENCARMRELAAQHLSKSDDIGPFFADIRDMKRRLHMAGHFLGEVKRGSKHLRIAIEQCHFNSNYAGIDHSRNWIADLLPIATSDSHNAYNKLMFQSPNYEARIGNPYNNIAIRSARLGKDKDILKNYFDVAIEVAQVRLREEKDVIRNLTPEILANLLQRFRMDAAIKLQKLNPLYVLVNSISENLGLTANYGGVQSLLSDFSDPRDPVGKYDLFTISDARVERSIQLCIVSVHDNNGDHKSKEWGARRRSMLYRLVGGTPSRCSTFGVFVTDGEWSAKDIKRLYLSGWDAVIGVNDLEVFLSHYFFKRN